jgi:hypothetical protein
VYVHVSWTQVRIKSRIKIANKFQILGTTLTNKNEIHETIKIRFNIEIGCYHFFQNFRLLLVSFPVVFCGRETWSVTLRNIA